MSEDQFGRGPGSIHPVPARTPRPRRLLMVARVEAGHEVQVRYWQARFPHEAAQASGIDAVEAFVGSGYYALSLETRDEDVQHALSAFFNDPVVRAFFGHLGDFVDGLPDPKLRFGAADDFHGDRDRAGGDSDDCEHYTTSDLPLAAGMYRWRAGSEPSAGDEPVRPSLL